MGSSAIAALARSAIAAMNDPKTRKAVSGILVAVLSPLILLTAFLCSLGSGASQHNRALVDALFFGGTLTPGAPVEVREEFDRVSGIFAQIDSLVANLNRDTEGGEIDVVQVKAAFYAMCLEDPAMTASDAAGCFYSLETRTRTVTTLDESGNEIETEEKYTVVVPKSLGDSYASLASKLDRAVTADDLTNIQNVYFLVCGRGGEDYNGAFLRGSGHSTAIDTSGFTEPATKNAHDLAAYAVQAWKNSWGYVWGTYGNVLTESLLRSKINQYPDGVGEYEDIIRTKWLNGRTADCVGLIKGYGWLDPETLSIHYATHGMPDIGANAMCRAAKVKGAIDTIPEVPGLAVWMDGHIGVYIGGGEVIEASSTKRGVVKTQLEGRGWSCWLEIPYIRYD